MRTLLFAATLACAAAPAAHAQHADRTTEKLIAILVKNGVLTQSQAGDLLKEAQAEAATVAAPARVRTATRPPPSILTEASLTPTAPAAGVPVAAASPHDAPAAAPGSVRVTYVPDSIRRQIAAEVKQQVMQQSHDEGWTEPNVIPDWIQHVRIGGDVRIRGQIDQFPAGNSNLFPDFFAINTSANGFDTNASNLPPLLNTTQNRTRVRLRARLDVAAEVADWVGTDMRIGTGNDNSPVSPNQTLGNPGDFSRYALYLDRAYVELKPLKEMRIYAGRLPNPFWLSDLTYDEELNFDGFAAKGAIPVSHGLSVFGSGGAFPIYNTAFNLGTTNINKTKSNDSYLLAVQGGAEWQSLDDYAVKFGAGYFDYSNLQGKKSSLCVTPTAFGSCSTDSYRQPFSQFGNSVFALRNIDTSGGTNTAQPQLYGLASAFEVLNVRGQVTYSGFAPVLVSAEGEFIKNLGFNRKQVLARTPVNNLGNSAAYQGGDTGYLGRLVVGHPDLDKLWRWNMSIGYKYLESDATPDSFTDSKFHLGGTNAKGTVLQGNLGLARGVALSARWYSTNQVSGPAYAVDSFLFDLNAHF